MPSSLVACLLLGLGVVFVCVHPSFRAELLPAWQSNTGSHAWLLAFLISQKLDFPASGFFTLLEVKTFGLTFVCPHCSARLLVNFCAHAVGATNWQQLYSSLIVLGRQLPPKHFGYPPVDTKFTVIPIMIATKHSCLTMLNGPVLFSYSPMHMHVSIQIPHCTGQSEQLCTHIVGGGGNAYWFVHLWLY